MPRTITIPDPTEASLGVALWRAPGDAPATTVVLTHGDDALELRVEALRADTRAAVAALRQALLADPAVRAAFRSRGYTLSDTP